jgi:chromosome segregation ATPase
MVTVDDVRRLEADLQAAQNRYQNISSENVRIGNRMDQTRFELGNLEAQYNQTAQEQDRARAMVSVLKARLDAAKRELDQARRAYDGREGYAARKRVGIYP